LTASNASIGQSCARCYTITVSQLKATVHVHADYAFERDDRVAVRGAIAQANGRTGCLLMIDTRLNAFIAVAAQATADSSSSVNHRRANA